MTKVECPGPGFKGLKWKWIQDHAKEQQERERERLAVEQIQPPGSTQPHCQQHQSAAPFSCNEPPQTADIREQQTNRLTQSGGTWASTQHAPAGNFVSPHPSVKVEPVNGLPAGGPTSRASLVGDLNSAISEDRHRIKDEQEKEALSECRASPAAQTAPSALDTSIAGVLNASTSAIGGPAALAGPPGAAAGQSAVCPGVSLFGGGVSPSATLPAAGLPGRKSIDVTTAVPSASLSLATAVSPCALHVNLADTTQAPAPTAAGLMTTAQGSVAGHPAAVAPVCILTPPAVAATSTAAPQAAAVPVAQPSGTAPSSAPPLASGAPRVRLPPARAPSMTVAPVAMKGGDDFESMFTPLSSLPPTKSETPRAGLPSRSSSVLVSQGALSNAAPGGVTAGGSATAIAALDTGDRKGPAKKASRIQDSRSNAGQPSAGPASGAEQHDGDSAPAVRSRTPVSQLSPAGGPPTAGPGRDAPTTATAAGAPAAGKGQSQLATQLGQSTHQQSQQPAASGQQTQQQQQQRAQGGKAVKSGDGAAPVTAGPGSSGAVSAAAAGAGAWTAGNRGGAAGDRAGLPASAGSTPAAMPAHSGEPGERKRPRSEGSKPKTVASLTGDPLAASEPAWPYGETLADRIKRAKRATTSSSDQEGPHSHGGSAERLPSHVAAAMAGQAAAGDGQGNAGAVARAPDAQSPRPAVSAEAQSRGAEAVVPGSNPTRGSHVTAAGAAATPGSTGAGAGTSGVGSVNAKQQQQRQHPAASHPNASRGGGQTADKALDQPAQNPSNNNLRMSGGGAVTDSSGGGGGPAGAQRISGPSASGKTAACVHPPSGAVPNAGAKRSAAEVSRKHNGPPVKIPRSDPHLPRPYQPHSQDRRSAGVAETPAATAAAAAGSARVGSALPPPPSGKLAHRASSGPPTARVDGVAGHGDGQGAQAPVPAGPPSPSGRLGRAGEGDMPAAGSCKGPVVAGSRGSKDGAGDKGACGPRHAGNGMDAACGGGVTGGGGAGAAATTTTEPKTDSDTRTSRVVECLFEFDLPCRVAAGSASISGLGSGSTLQGAHGLAARLSGGRFFGGAGAAPPLPPPPPRSGAATAASQLLDLGKIHSFKELWTQLAALYDGTPPDEMDSKIIYLDEEGDWIMVTPDEPWSSVAAAATKVLITNRT